MMQPLGILLGVLAAVPTSLQQQPGTTPQQSPAAEARVEDGAVPVDIEHKARVYRIQVYQTFLRQRAELERRRAAWDEVLNSWKASGSPADECHKLIDWLWTATRNSTPSSLAPLPEPPSFGQDQLPDVDSAEPNDAESEEPSGDMIVEPGEEPDAPAAEAIDIAPRMPQPPAVPPSPAVDPVQPSRLDPPRPAGAESADVGRTPPVAPTPAAIERAQAEHSEKAPQIAADRSNHVGRRPQTPGLRAPPLALGRELPGAPVADTATGLPQAESHLSLDAPATTLPTPMDGESHVPHALSTVEPVVAPTPNRKAAPVISTQPAGRPQQKAPSTRRQAPPDVAIAAPSAIVEAVETEGKAPGSGVSPVESQAGPVKPPARSGTTIPQAPLRQEAIAPGSGIGMPPIDSRVHKAPLPSESLPQIAVGETVVTPAKPPGTLGSSAATPDSRAEPAGTLSGMLAPSSSPTDSPVDRNPALTHHADPIDLPSPIRSSVEAMPDLIERRAEPSDLAGAAGLRRASPLSAPSPEIGAVGGEVSPSRQAAQADISSEPAPETVDLPSTHSGAPTPSLPAGVPDLERSPDSSDLVSSTPRSVASEIASDVAHPLPIDSQAERRAQRVDIPPVSTPDMLAPPRSFGAERSTKQLRPSDQLGLPNEAIAPSVEPVQTPGPDMATSDPVAAEPLSRQEDSLDLPSTRPPAGETARSPVGFTERSTALSPIQPVEPPEATPGSAPRIAAVESVAVDVRKPVHPGVPPETMLAIIERPRPISDTIDEPPAAENPVSLPHTWVNVTELGARVAGTNMALRELSTELADDSVTSADRLAPIVVKLNLLATRHGDSLLLYDLIAERDKRAMGKPASPAPVIAQLERRISQARARAAGPDFPGSESERITELRLLGEFSRTLADLTSP